MKQIIAFVTELTREEAEALASEAPGTTALCFYPLRNALIQAGINPGSGELLFVDGDKILFHQVINAQESSLYALKDVPPQQSLNPYVNGTYKR